MRWFVVVLVMVCSLNFALAATLPAPLDDYFRESWTTRDGLPHNTINDIIQSNDGYLWFATWEGAARYDGRSFQVFGRTVQTALPDAGVRAFTLQPDGQLLVGGARGGMSLVRDGPWQPIPAVGKLINQLLRDKQNRLWIATEGGGLILQDEAGAFSHFDASHGLNATVIYALLLDGRGQLWVGTQQGLFLLDTQAEVKQFRQLGPSDGIPITSVFALTMDADEQLLVGTEHGAYRLTEQTFTLLHPKLAQTAVSELMVDKQQQLWLGTVSQGVMRLGERGLEQLTTTDGLPNNRVLALWQDRENSIWIGTNAGVLRLRDAPFTNLNMAKGLSGDYVRTLLEHSDGSVWVGSSDGLDLWRDGKVQPVLADNGQPLASVLSLAEGPDGDVWVGSYSHGLFRLRQGKVQAHYDRSRGLSSNEIRTVLPLSDGSVWVGTSGGLNHLTAADNTQADKTLPAKTLISDFHVADGLPGEFITALKLASDGTLWVGTGSGLARFSHGKFVAFNLQQLDGADYVFHFYQQPETADVWFATDRGLVRYQASSATFALVGKTAGMPVDKIFAIVAEKDHHFWLSSNRGVLRVSTDEVNAIADGQQASLQNYQLFGESDGMQSAQSNGGSMPSAVARRDGSLWFATSQGVAMVQPARLTEFVRHTPPVVIQQVYADGQSYPLSTERFAAGTRRLALQFAGLSYVMPTRIQYRTKLVGFDQDWVLRGSQHLAEYTNLPPGQYQFLVSAAYPDGEWSDEAAVLEFSIEPFFWQRGSFIIASALLLILTLLLLYRWRVMSLRRSEQKLRLQVRQQTAALREQAQVLTLAVEEKSALAEQLRQQAEAFAAQAREDGLTGLANRRAFDEQLALEFNRAARQHSQLCLVILDIDHFKRINDDWSHLTGDEVLKQIARVLQQHSRDIDLTARWGGEEFALLLPGTSLAQGQDVCERLRAAIAALDFSSIAPGLQVTASFGLAVNTGLPHYDKLISRADSLLYQAKALGRDRVCS